MIARAISFYDIDKFTEEVADLLRAYRNTHHGYLRARIMEYNITLKEHYELSEKGFNPMEPVRMDHTGTYLD